MNSNRNGMQQDMISVLVLVIVGLAATSNLWGDFQLYGHSAHHDYFRQLSFDRCISAGILYPRWMPDAYYGYGSPHFNFYSPLPYYFTELFVLTGVKVYSAMKLTMALSLIFSGLVMYLFCRDFAAPAAAFIAGLAYMLAPYHLVDMLVRHAMGEHMAFIFVPLAAWGLAGMTKGHSMTRLLTGVIGFGALILTHNITAMIGMGALMLWWVVLSIYERNATSIVWGGLLLGWGLAITAFFWVPAVIEKEFVYAEESLTSDYFNYQDHFVEPIQLVKPYWGFGVSKAGGNDTISLQIGIPHWLFVFAGVAVLAIVLCRRRQMNPVIPYGLFLFAGSVFMMLPLSGFVYRWAPILAYAQFPWRFLFYAVYASSLLAISVETLLAEFREKLSPVVTYTILPIVIIAFYASYTLPAAYVYSEKKHRFTAVSATELHDGRGSGQYTDAWRMWSLDYFRNHGEHAGEGDEYLPRWVDRDSKPVKTASEEVIWEGQGDALLNWSSDHPWDLEVHVSSDQDGVVEFSRFYYPGWEASVNGRPSEINIHPLRGTILLPVEAGVNTVELQFGTTPLRRYSGIVSLIAVLLFPVMPLLDRFIRTAR